MAERWHLLRIDDTAAWCDSVRARAARVWTVYAYRPGERTYCCELAPSYALHYLGDVVEPRDGLSDEEYEALCVDVIDGSASTEPVSYMHCARVDRVPLVVRNRSTSLLDAQHVDAGEFGEDDDADKGEAAVREWWNGNPIW